MAAWYGEEVRLAHAPRRVERESARQARTFAKRNALRRRGELRRGRWDIGKETL